jgi:hypothetical protein
MLLCHTPTRQKFSIVILYSLYILFLPDFLCEFHGVRCAVLALEDFLIHCYLLSFAVEHFAGSRIF